MLKFGSSILIAVGFVPLAALWACHSIALIDPALDGLRRRAWTTVGIFAFEIAVAASVLELVVFIRIFDLVFGPFGKSSPDRLRNPPPAEPPAAPPVESPAAE